MNLKNVIKRKLKSRPIFDNEIIEACYDGNIDKVRDLVKEGVDDINVIGHMFENLLLEAIFKNDEKGVNCYISLIDEVGYICEYTPLIAACQSGNNELVRLLIDNGADVNMGGVVCEMRPLAVASLRGNENVVKRLIDCNVKKTYYNIDESGIYYEVSPLTVACVNRDEKIVRLLLETEGININMEEEFISGTALAFACKEEHSDIAKLLIKCGADINKRVDIVYDNALSIVVDEDCKNIESLLLNLKAQNVKRAERNRGLLEIAKERKNDKLIKYLGNYKNENQVI